MPGFIGMGGPLGNPLATWNMHLAAMNMAK